MLCGSAFRVYEYKAWLALKNYKIEADSPVLEERLWKVFPSRCLKFWPYLKKDCEGFKDFLERDIPVTVETKMSGFFSGNFTTSIKWVQAWIKVLWRGKFWYISEDGKMWACEKNEDFEDIFEDMNNFMLEKNKSLNVVWKIPEQLNSDNHDSDIIQTPLSGVFKTPVSTEKIASFLEEFKGYSWFQDITEITWERRAGLDLFILRLSKGKQTFEVQLQQEKYSGWDLGLLIESVISDLIKEGGNHIIDATYNGKILLRGLRN